MFYLLVCWSALKNSIYYMNKCKWETTVRWVCPPTHTVGTNGKNWKKWADLGQFKMEKPVKVRYADNPIFSLLFHYKVEDTSDYAWLLCTLKLILEALLQCTKAQLHLVQQQVGARKCRRKERTREKRQRMTEDQLKTFYMSISYLSKYSNSQL